MPLLRDDAGGLQFVYARYRVDGEPIKRRAGLFPFPLAGPGNDVEKLQYQIREMKAAIEQPIISPKTEVWEDDDGRELTEAEAEQLLRAEEDSDAWDELSRDVK